MKYDVISGRFGSGVATAFESRVRSPACHVNRRRPTQRAATVLKVKAVVAFKGEGFKRSAGGCQMEGLLVTHHGVEDGEHFTHTGSNGDFLLLAAFH